MKYLPITIKLYELYVLTVFAIMLFDRLNCNLCLNNND